MTKRTADREEGPPRTSEAAASATLNYGAGQISFQYEPETFSVLSHRGSSTRALGEADLHAALDNPIAAPPLEEGLRATGDVLIVVPDATRAAGADRLVPVLRKRLNESGVPDGQISILIGGGSHRLPTPAEVVSILGPEMPRVLAVHTHDSRDPSASVHLGETSRGTPVELNRRVVEADRVILVGAIGFHYIAGFSGGRKGLLPGCASELSVRAHHLLAFDPDTLSQRAGVATGRLDGNPVHENLEEAARMIEPPFLFNTVVNDANDIVAAYAGDLGRAHRRGCEEYAAAHSAALDVRRPLVVASCGGRPRDINLIQSHKAIEHAAGALEEGGAMVVLAECPQGLGRDDFLDWFVPGGARATARRLVENYHVNGQTAWGLRAKSERFRILLVSSLAPGVVREMGLEPHPSLESALSAAGHERGYVLPNAASTLPSLNSAAPRASGAR